MPVIFPANASPCDVNEGKSDTRVIASQKQIQKQKSSLTQKIRKSCSHLALAFQLNCNGHEEPITNGLLFYDRRRVHGLPTATWGNNCFAQISPASASTKQIEISGRTHHFSTKIARDTTGAVTYQYHYPSQRYQKQQFQVWSCHALPQMLCHSAVQVVTQTSARQSAAGTVHSGRSERAHQRCRIRAIAVSTSSKYHQNNVCSFSESCPVSLGLSQTLACDVEPICNNCRTCVHHTTQGFTVIHNPQQAKLCPERSTDGRTQLCFSHNRSVSAAAPTFEDPSPSRGSSRADPGSLSRLWPEFLDLQQQRQVRYLSLGYRENPGIHEMAVVLVDRRENIVC